MQNNHMEILLGIYHARTDKRNYHQINQSH